jgi:cytochrome c oxidase subunit 2
MFAGVAAFASGAIADEAVSLHGLKNWGLGFQDATSPNANQIHSFHNELLIIITVIVVFVMVLLLYVMFRFSEKRNPSPSRTTHNTLIEVIWTAVPVIILVVIAIPSFRLLYEQDKVDDAEITIKAIGKQWFWSYEYPDHGNFTFDAYLVEKDDLEKGQPYLLTTDNAVVLPVDTKIRVLVTGGDVIHSFAMPTQQRKIDAVPGRINETAVYFDRTGTFYGQCSEICGTRHAYMPIMVRVVSKEEFAAWTETAKEEFARVDGPAPTVRLAQTRVDGLASATNQNMNETGAR